MAFHNIPESDRIGRMPETQRWSEKFPLYPLMVGLYPLLQLFAANFQQTPAYSTLRALIFSLAVTLVTWGLFLILYRRRVRAALAASGWLVLFFSYGHLYGLLAGQQAFGFTLGRHQYLTSLWVLLALGWVALIFRLPRPEKLNRVFFALSAVLFLFNLIQIAGLSFQTGRVGAAADAPQPSSFQKKNPQPNDETYRDVYYIILDGYSRSDEMKKMGYDNSVFLEQLKELGFTVLDCAHSNYTNTAESLSSSLNMDYVGSLGIDDYETEENHVIPKASKLMRHSKVRSVFEEMGYRVVTFATKLSWVNISDSDFYFDVTTGSPALEGLNTESGKEKAEGIPYLKRAETLSFYELFYDTTLMRAVPTAQKSGLLSLHSLPAGMLEWLNPRENVFSSLRYWEYQQNQYALKGLGLTPQIPGRKLVIAHLMTTHSSFVFNRDGSFKPEEMETGRARQAYLEQVEYLDGQLIPILQNILEKSAVKPIIVIQGDHGFPGSSEMDQILNAFYLPDGGAQSLDPALTPVNTFRTILDTYFGGQYGQIENRTYLLSHKKVIVQPVTCP